MGLAGGLATNGFIGGSSSRTAVKTLASFNGATDGTAINAALTALGGPGAVLLPAGTGIVDTTITLDAGQWLIGCGWGTVLQAKNSLNAAVVSNLVANSVGLGVKDLVIDGNRGNNASGAGISFNWTGNTISSVSPYFWGATLDSLYIRFCAGDGYTGVNSTNGMGAQGVHLWIDRCNGNGFTIQHSDSTFANCQAEKNGLAGFAIGPNGATTHLTNCLGNDSGQVTAASGHGFNIVSGYCVLTGCGAQDNSLHGYYVNTAGAIRNTFNGCHADSNSFANAAATAAGFYVDTGTLHTNIYGCQSFDRFAGGSRTQAYGYFVNDTADYVQIDSTGDNNITALIRNVSTGTHNVTPTAIAPTRGWNQPTGTLSASMYDRATAKDLTTAAPASGTLFGAYLPVQPGDLLSNVFFTSGSTAGATLTHQWAGLWDLVGNLLAVSADNTGASWTAQTEQQFTLASPYRVPDGVTGVYAMVCVVGTTMPTLLGNGFLSTALDADTPFTAINGTAGNTVPGSASNPSVVVTSSKSVYARVS